MQIELSSSEDTISAHQGNIPLSRSFCECDAALCFVLLPETPQEKGNLRKHVITCH